MPRPPVEVRVDKLVRKIQQLRDRYGRFVKVRVEVGFSAPYAVFIHENMEIWPPGMRLKGLPRRGKNHVGRYWDPQGKARPKYLSSAANDLREEMAKLVRYSLNAKKTLTAALMVAARRLLHEARERVPVEFGTLKASGFVRIDEGSE